MSAEVSIGVVPQVEINRRGPDRPFSIPRPINSVVQRITVVPDEFTKIEQVAVLRACGFGTEQIGTVLGKMSVDAVDQIVSKQATRLGLTTTSIAVSIIEAGRLPLNVITNKINLKKRKYRLTEPQQEVISLISRKDMWGATDKELAFELNITRDAFRARLLRAYLKLGIRNRYQAIIFGIYMPSPGEKRSKVITKRCLDAITLKAKGFAEAEIAGELRMSVSTVRQDMARVNKGHQSLVDAIVSRLENGTIDKGVVEEELEFECYDSLSPNEQAILEDLLASRDAGGNKGIAKRLGFPEQSVKNNMSNIFRKLGVGDRNQAAVFEYLRVKAVEGKARAISRRQASVPQV